MEDYDYEWKMNRYLNLTALLEGGLQVTLLRVVRSIFQGWKKNSRPMVFQLMCVVCLIVPNQCAKRLSDIRNLKCCIYDSLKLTSSILCYSKYLYSVYQNNFSIYFFICLRRISSESHDLKNLDHREFHKIVTHEIFWTECIRQPK